MASSSIPLPALDVRPAQSPDALSQYGKALEMKSLLGQQQLQQQQVQQNELQLEQSRALIGAAKGVDWTKDDAFDKFLTNANSSGKVSPQVLSSMSLQRAQYKEQLAKTDLAGLSVEKEANSQLLGHIDALKGITDPVKRAQASQDQATQILSNPELLKHVQPQTLQMLGAMKSGQYVPDDEHLTFFENGLTDRMSQADLAEKNAKASAEASQAALNQIKINLSKNSKPGDFDKLIDQAAPQNGPNASLNLRTKSMVNFALQRGDYEGAQKAIEQMSGQIGGVEKEIAINTNPQIQAGKEAVAAAEGQAKAKAFGQNREYQVFDSQTGQTSYMTPDEINAAKQNSPGRFTAPSYTPEAQIEKQTGKTFGPGGKGSEEVLAFDTALQHADLLQKASDALKNGDVRALNSLGNQLGVQFGSNKATNFQVIANAYSREVTKALSAGHLTDAEIKEQGATLPANASPEQITGALNSYKALMQSKVNLRKQQFEAGKRGKTTLEEPNASDPFAQFGGQKR